MAHSFDTDTEAQGLIDFVDASPTPFHACEQAARRLREGGFSEVVETEPWPTQPGRHYLVRGGSSARTPTVRTCASSRTPTT
jgi:aspartyl aminopeptidase